mgnify:CR=1 FL=1
MQQQNYYDQYEGVPPEYSTPPKNYENSEQLNVSLVQQLSPQKDLREIMEHLEGKMWDNKQKKYIKIEGAKPLMNREGINSFFHHATALINPITTMSNYGSDQKMIHRLIKLKMNNASIDFHINYKDYGICKKTHISTILDKLMLLGISAYYKALGAGDRKAATSNISENISTMVRDFQGGQQYSNAPKKSFLNKMIPFGR